MNDDTVSTIMGFLNFRDWWSFSRTSHRWYNSINPKLHRWFSSHIYKRIETTCKIPGLIPLLDPEDYVLTGSLVWSTMMGVKWKWQDADFFMTDAPNRQNRLYQRLQQMQLPDTTLYQTRHGDYPEARNIITVMRHDPDYNKQCDLVFTSLDSPYDAIDSFDIIGCMCSFSPTELRVGGLPSETLFGQTHVNPTRHLADSEVFSYRIDKYKNRGITFSS